LIYVAHFEWRRNLRIIRNHLITIFSRVQKENSTILGKIWERSYCTPVLPVIRDPLFLKQIKMGKKGSIVHRKMWKGIRYKTAIEKSQHFRRPVVVPTGPSKNGKVVKDYLIVCRAFRYCFCVLLCDTIFSPSIRDPLCHFSFALEIGGLLYTGVTGIYCSVVTSFIIFS